MLIPRKSSGRTRRQQGSCGVDLAELRCRLAEPSGLNDACRQRLRDLARRLARVQALGDEYARVELSPYAQEAMTHAEGDIAIA